jgi:hypothetical protein
MPHNNNNNAGLELTIPIEKKEQHSMREDNSASMIPFPDVPTNLPDLELGNQQASADTTATATTKAKVKPEFSLKLQRLAKFVIFLVVVGVLFFGRFSVPEDSVPCIVDKVLDGLKVPNDFINTAGRESYRRGFQILGSLLIDLTFLTTFIYWIIKTTTLRFPLTLGAFYLTRMIVQKFWISPFPEGFYWDDPGFPSLVVPYGRGSDFFFSGHAGFVVICLREMWVAKQKKTSAIMTLVLAYTIMCLLIYRIHYSIDIFTGVFFADWCFLRVQQICDALIDPLAIKILLKLKHKYISIKKRKLQGASQAQPDQDQRQAEVEINKPEIKLN